MAVYKKKDLGKLLDEAGDSPASLYVFTGERSLCLDAVAALLARLFPDEGERSRAVWRIDGEQENLREIMGHLRTASMFSCRRVVLVDDTGLFRSRKVADRTWNRAVEALAAGDEGRARGAVLGMLAAAGVEPGELGGLDDKRWQDCFGFPRPDDETVAAAARLVAGAALPEKGGSDGVEDLAAWAESENRGGNILILLAPDIDRRTGTYKKISKHAAVVDLKVDTGASKAAQQSRAAILEERLRQALDRTGRRMGPAAARLLLDRVGFHPEAVVTEVEKLALHDSEADEISLESVRELVPVTGEHAIFELTEAFFARRFAETAALLDRLVEGGMHPLAVIAGIRNQARKLLIAGEAARDPEVGFSPSMSFASFQKNCLPGLKERDPDLARGHPYAVYMLLSRAAAIPEQRLVMVLAELLECERMMKGSGVAEKTLLFAAIIRCMFDWPGKKPPWPLAGKTGRPAASGGMR